MEESNTESNINLKVVALTRLQYYINSINRLLRNWVDLKYGHMTHKFFGGGGTYIGKYKNNETN